MENMIQEMAPLYALYIASGLLIYALSTWIGEALVDQIKDNKTTLFGGEKKNQNRSHTMYVPPALIKTANTASIQPKREFHLPPAIPQTQPAKTYSNIPALPKVR